MIEACHCKISRPRDTAMRRGLSCFLIFVAATLLLLSLPTALCASFCCCLRIFALGDSVCLVPRPDRWESPDTGLQCVARKVRWAQGVEGALAVFTIVRRIQRWTHPKCYLYILASGCNEIMAVSCPSMTCTLHLARMNTVSLSWNMGFFSFCSKIVAVNIAL